MKQVIAILFFLSTLMIAYAGDDCDSKILNATRLYEQGLYETAKGRFDYCLRHCGENYKDVCIDWIKKCDNMIYAKKQEQNRRIQAEKEAVLRLEREANERTKRRERNRLVYLSIFSDVPGRFSRIENQLKSNLRWTNDSLEAYWFVRVAVEIFEQPAIEQMPCYRVEAVVEVDNATELDFETKSSFVFDEAHCYMENMQDPQEAFGNMIYENKDHHLYKDIETSIKELLGENDNSITLLPEKAKNVIVVYIDYADSSKQRTFITEPLQMCLRSRFKENGYIVKNNDKKIDAIIREILVEEPGHLSSEKLTSIIEEGVDKVCYVRIIDDNDYLEFYCQLIELATNNVLKSCSFPFSNRDVKNKVEVTRLSNKNTIEVVADILAYQLDLLSNSQIIELKKKIRSLESIESLLTRSMTDTHKRSMTDTHKRSMTDTYNTDNTLAFLESAILPGLGQIKKGYELNGLLIMSCEGFLALVTFANYGLCQQLYSGFMNKPVNIEDVNAYNTHVKVHYALVGVMAGLYIYNLIQTVRLKPLNSDSVFIAPILLPMDNTVAMGMGLTLNF